MTVRSLYNKHFKKFLLTIAMIVVFLVISISLIKQGKEGYSELALLMYDTDTKKYVATNYPKILNSDKNLSVFFIVKNFQEVPTYYQVQIKITAINQTLSIKEPLSLRNSYLLYPNETFEKILSHATNKEKLNSTVLFAPYIWAPTNVTLFFKPLFSDIINGNNMLKIVFELWRFDVDSNEFIYSGIFAYLKLFHYY